MKTISKTTMTKTRKTGSLFLVLLAIAAGFGLPANARGQEKKPASVIAGTVFREPGFALPGAVVTLEQVELAAKGKRNKPQKVACDAHGEFAFRLPPSGTKFKLTAVAKGFASQTKETAAVPGVRVDTFFELKPESR
jgi:Carboxypeptidase regulatory-like domain